MSYEELPAEHQPVLPVLATEQDMETVYRIRDGVFADGAVIRTLADGFFSEAVESFHAVEQIRTPGYRGYKRRQHDNHVNRLRDGVTIYSVLVEQAEVLQDVVDGNELSDDVSAGWVMPVRTKLDRVRGKKRQSIHTFIAGTEQNPSDMLIATQKTLMHVSDGLDTIYGSLGLELLERAAQYPQFEQFRLGRKVLEFSDRLKGLKDTAFESPEEHALAKMKIFSAVRATLRYVSSGTSIINPIGKTTKDKLQRAKQDSLNGVSAAALLRGTTAYDISLRLQSFSRSYDSWADFHEEKAGSLGYAVVSHITPGVEHEQEDSAADFQEIFDHLGQLQQAHATIGTYWSIKKSQLKASGLSELSRSFVAGARGKDWEIAGIPKDRAWQTLGVLHRCAELLSRGQTYAQESLYGDEVMEHAVANDFAHISGWFKSQSIRPETDGSYGELEPSLTRTIAYLRQNWPNIRPAINQNWPAATRPNINELEKLIFSLPADEADSLSDLDTSEQQELLPEDQVNSLGASALKPVLVEIAEQLDWVVLPPMSFSDVKGFAARLYNEQELASVDWGRLENLIMLQEALSGKLYRSKHGALGTTTPYFVVVFETANSTGGSMTFAVAENPLYANATYIVREDLADGSWQKVLNEYKRDARVLGAHQIIHAPGADHLAKLQLALQDLATVKPPVRA